MDQVILYVYYNHMTIIRSSLLDGMAAGDARMLLCRAANLQAWSMPHMAMPYWRLYLPFSPGGRLKWDGRTWTLIPGRWVLIAPGTDSAASLDRPYTKAYAHFLWVPPGKRPVEGIHEGALDQGVIDRLRDLLHRGDGRAFGLLMQAVFRQLMASLTECALADAPTGLSPAVQRALEILRVDPSSTPGNATLAAAVGLHPGSLIRLFKQEIGRPPQQEAMRFRLEHAAMLLAESGDDLESIASACGFADRHHFSRAFARHWRQPPAAFRRQMNPGLTDG